MAGRCVLVVTNLKPAKMRDVMSYGMVGGRCRGPLGCVAAALGPADVVAVRPTPIPALMLQVLCASNDTHDQVDPVNPPEGVPLGERVTFEGCGRLVGLDFRGPGGLCANCPTSPLHRSAAS